MIKVLQANITDIKGGAAKAAYRTHQALLGQGVDSQYIVGSKNIYDPTVYAPHQFKDQLWSSAAWRYDLLPLKKYPNFQNTPFSVSAFPGIGAHHIKKDAQALDLVHLHWINGGFIRIEDLKHFKKPIVWTLHDQWAFTGGCHYAFDCTKYQQACGACHQLGSSEENDLSRKIFLRKQKAWNDLPLHIVTPSQWLYDAARSSTLFKNLPIVRIPNAIDTDCYKPLNSEFVREFLSLPKDKKLILFNAFHGTSVGYKGFSFLQEALQKLSQTEWKEKLALVILGGEVSPELSELGVPYYHLGYLADEYSVVAAYNAVDLFVTPSLQDNLPNTVIESLACGTPAIGFDIGGIPEMVLHKETGYLARPKDSDDLVAGIQWALSERGDGLQRLKENARKHVMQNYAYSVVGQQILDLYQSILNQSV